MRRVLPVILFLCAVAVYSANVVLGTVVALRGQRLRHRWPHHALYIATVGLTVGALSSAAWGTPRDRVRQAACVLAPAMVPLAVIPAAEARSVRHPVIALVAAPFLMAGALRAGSGVVGKPRSG